MGSLHEDDEPGNSRSERTLDAGEVRLVLPRPDTVCQVVNRAVHAVHQRGRARRSAVDIAKQIVAPKERKNLHTPENIVVGRELDGDEVAKVERWRERSRGNACRRRVRHGGRDGWRERRHGIGTRG